MFRSIVRRILTDISEYDDNGYDEERTASPLMSICAVTKFFPIPDASTSTAAMLRDPSGPLKTFQNQLTHSLVTNGRGRCTHGTKLVIKGEKVPLASTATGVEESRS